ncbi:MAG: PQQ-binding-like beta-propeller repeat protein [Ignavibacteriaceae bacterium]|nr:PQQ-binding-like beta-propeller repeat protein [Ignavibacteriaceae bacterium]
MQKLSLIFIITILTSISSYTQNWPTIGGSNQRNGLSKIIGPDSVITPAWTVSSSQTSIGNSVFTFGDKFVTARAVFSPYTSKLEYRSLIDGSIIWEKMVYPTSIMYTVGFNEDAVYAHDYSNDTLYALSPIDGSVKWAVNEYMFGGNSGILFACNGDPIVRGKRLDKNTGQTIWFYDYIVPVGPNAGYAASSTTFYHYKGAINTPKTLFALDIETGQFKYETGSLPGDGDQEWPITIGIDGTIYMKRDGGKLYAFEDTGTELRIKWEYTPTATEMPGYFGSAANGNLYIVDNDTVKLLNSQDGTVLNKSSISVDASFYSTISVDGEGNVFVNNNSNKMFCFSPDLQTVIWELGVPNLTYCGAALGKDGTLVITGGGFNIKAYKPNKPFKPVADFKADSTQIFNGSDVSFSDQSSFQPTAWQWSFPGGIPSSSTDQNPENIFYNSPGIYEVSLIATNALGSDTLVKSCYIEVLEVVFVHDDGISPEEFILYQNYPNPFNPVTSISWQSPVNGWQSLKIYDVLGNEVATLVNEERPAGRYEAQFNAADLTSGIYFYRLQVGNFIETKKMTLLK